MHLGLSVIQIFLHMVSYPSMSNVDVTYCKMLIYSPIKWFWWPFGRVFSSSQLTCALPFALWNWRDHAETEKLWLTEQTFHSGNFKFWLVILHSSKQHGKKKSYLYVSKGFEKILKHPVFDSILPATWIWNMRKVSREYRKSDDSQKEMDCVLLKNKTYPNMQE